MDPRVIVIVLKKMYPELPSTMTTKNYPELPCTLTESLGVIKDDLDIRRMSLDKPTCYN